MEALGTIGKVCLVIGLSSFVVCFLIDQWVALFPVAVMVAFGIGAQDVAPVRVKQTEEGATESTQWKAFRDYIKKVMEDKKVLVENLSWFDRYLPYAVCFGVGGGWVGNFANLDQLAPVPSWYYIHLMH
ncbi:DUF2207 family protein, partial [Chloroflexota bacterium]